MKYANLHLHSTYSDSQMTPLQLVLIGKSLGYRALALTDHETDGGVPEFFAACQHEGLDSIAGVEFYGMFEGHNLHITALDYDMDHPAFRAFVKRLCDERLEHTQKCFERGLRLGYLQGITWDDVMDMCYDGTWVCIDHVFRAMRKKKVMDLCGGEDTVRKNVFKGPEPRSFMHPHPSAEEVIHIIRQADGVATLAHPYQQTQFVPKLVEMGLNGIEVSHPDLYENSSYLALEAADTYKLYRSGGTDHTGAMSGCNGIYAIPALQGITEEEYTLMKERRLG